jgi:hypothetical protein
LRSASQKAARARGFIAHPLNAIQLEEIKQCPKFYLH